MSDLDKFELAWGIGAGLLSISSLIHLFTGEGMYEVIMCQCFAWFVFSITKITTAVWSRPQKPIDDD